MFNLQKIYDFENEFPRHHSFVCEKPYGKLFYAAGNPLSHDSNHAVILDLECDLPRVLDEIIQFYDDMEITPRVYGTYRGQEEEKLIPLLKARGFSMKTDSSKIFFHRNRSRIEAAGGLDVQKMQSLDRSILEIMQTGDQEYFGEWSAKVLEKMIGYPNFHLLVGFLDANPVCMASVYLADGFSRVDDVLVLKEYRGRGYGRTIIGEIVRYHESIAGGNVLYLWAENPAAIRIYRAAGFVECSTQVPFWSAWKEKLSVGGAG